MTADLAPLDAAVLPGGVRARFVPGVNGLTVHMLEAGQARAPCLLLLQVSQAGLLLAACHARSGGGRILRGRAGSARYGRTTGWNADYDADLSPWRPTNLARDAMGLVYALGCPICCRGDRA